jgi:hypothetical protein
MARDDPEPQPGTARDRVGALVALAVAAAPAGAAVIDRSDARGRLVLLDPAAAGRRVRPLRTDGAPDAIIETRLGPKGAGLECAARAGVAQR